MDKHMRAEVDRRVNLAMAERDAYYRRHPELDEAATEAMDEEAFYHNAVSDVIAARSYLSPMLTPLAEDEINALLMAIEPEAGA